MNHCKRALLIFSLSMAFMLPGLYRIPSVAAQQAPSIICWGASNVSCSFVVWDSHGSAKYTVAPQSKILLSTAMVGFKYCMNASPQKPPEPKSPECYGKPNAWNHSSGVLGPGRNR
jgi:hypothetical protein